MSVSKNQTFRSGTSYLTAEENGAVFSNILITTEDGRVIFRFGPEAKYFPEVLPLADHAGWFYQPETVSVFRAYFRPLRLGELGMGKLVLLRKIDHTLLFQNAHAHSHLSLMWNGKQVASCTHPIPEDARIDKIGLPWFADEGAAPVLLIRSINHPLISSAAIAVASLLALAGIFLLLWWILGRWILQNTRRITALGRASHEFVEGHELTPLLKSHLASAANHSEDEISQVARSLENLAEAVVQREAALRESENRIREITDSVADGVIEVDPRGIITFVNPQAERFLGWNAAELLGKDSHATFHYLAPDGSILPANPCIVHQAIRMGESFQTDLDYFVRRDKRTFPVSLAATPIIREGEVKGAVMTFRDISVQRRPKLPCRKARSASASSPTTLRPGKTESIPKAACNGPI